MILLLNPLLEGLEVARRAAADAINHSDEVTVDDQGDHWIFEFIPRGEALGGGARVSIAKDDFRVLKVIRGPMSQSRGNPDRNRGSTPSRPCVSLPSGNVVSIEPVFLRIAIANGFLSKRLG